MDIGKITERSLLENPSIRSVDFEHQNYFSRNDLDRAFMGSFRHIESVPLPLLSPDGSREIVSCISWQNISKHVTMLSGKSEFQQRINTVLNFNPKKK